MQIFYSVRSERLLIEQLDYNRLFRWFVGLSVEDAVLDHSVFAKNRDRLVAHEVGWSLLPAMAALTREKDMISDEHFSVDGTLIEAWASMKSFRIVDTVSISERPPTVADRAVPGHWEGDLLFGSNNSQIATLAERQTRYVMLVRVGKKDTETIINALIKHAHKLPQELYKSLTWDRGKEMADHEVGAGTG